MTTIHDQFQWVAGDDCQINATLLKQDDTPFNLSGPLEIKWTLMDASYQRVIETEDVVISIVDAAAGTCSIMIPAAITSPLEAGNYTDVIRIIIGGITSTLSWGIIAVKADPWAAGAAVTASKALPRIRLASAK